GVVLLGAPRDRGHLRPGGHGEVPRPRRGRGARRAGLVGRVPGGAAGEVRDVVQLGLGVLERPGAPGPHRQRGGGLAAAGDQVTPFGQGEGGRLHDQPVLLEPPVLFVEPPAGGGRPARRLELGVIPQPDAARPWVQGPQAPVLRAGAGVGLGVPQCGDELGGDPLEPGGGIGLGDAELAGSEETRNDQRAPGQLTKRWAVALVFRFLFL
ncbi:unnamed protein product, partial [Heterosigma akashiwo]